MIDAEGTIYSTLIERLQSKYTWASDGSVGFSNDYITQPETFPWVTFCEEDNRTEIKYHDTSNEENAVRLTYQLDVWTNNIGSRKRVAREITNAIDKELLAMGFRRTYLNNDPSLQDVSLYRYIGRYSVICEEREGDFLLYHRP